jgi:hypothetical protein
MFLLYFNCKQSHFSSNLTAKWIPYQGSFRAKMIVLSYRTKRQKSGQMITMGLLTNADSEYLDKKIHLSVNSGRSLLKNSAVG